MPRPSLIAASLEEVALAPAPIDPSWIIEGAPVARSALWSTSTDGTKNAFVWDCTAGAFRWRFDGDEIVHIMAGEVIVETDDHLPRALRPGDAAIFYAGTWAVWTVPVYVRKHAICATVTPAAIAAPLSLARRAMAKARRIISGAPEARGLVA